LYDSLIHAALEHGDFLNTDISQVGQQSFDYKFTNESARENCENHLRFDGVTAVSLVSYFSMVALWNRADDIYFHAVVCSSFFFSCLISAAADWVSAILPHMVWP